MGRAVKDTTALSFRLSSQMVGEIEEAVSCDSRFSNLAEFISFCIKTAYGDIICSIGGEKTGDPQEKLTERDIVASLTEVRMKVDGTLSLLDTYYGDTSVIQVRISKEFLKDIDTLCNLISIKRIDFLKYSIFSHMIRRADFRLDAPSFGETWMISPEAEDEAQKDWETAIRDEVRKELRAKAGIRTASEKRT